MDTPPPTSSSELRREADFQTTRWTQVLAAAGADQRAAQDGLVHLCESYWYPLYAYVRRRGHDAEEAKDLVQGFFARLLARRDFGDLAPEKGRFRAFLLAAMKNFLANARAREQAAKRGGGRVSLSIDFDRADHRYRVEPEHAETPERIFERNWALELLARTLVRLEEECRDEGRGRLFEALRPLLQSGEESRSYQELADELGMTEGAIKVSALRLRRRYRDCLRVEIADTVRDESDVEDELGRLFEALSRG